MADSFDIHNSLTSGSSVGHTSNFPQTGSWSMVDLLSKPLNVTVGILQRYSAGRVDPYTAVVGQAMCQRFRLGSVGRKRLDEALSSLSVIGSLGDALYFGFGAEDLVRSLAKTEEGAICLALCAALRECYHEEVAVEVLLELGRLTSVPGKYMPSSFEWKALLNACSGALATTTFALQAEQLMSLSELPERLGAFGAVDASPSSLRSCSSPKSLAEALFAIARVTREDLKAITIMGGADAGWLGALSQWLFDCKIKVTFSDGSVVYQNVQEDEQVQIHFVFQGLGAGGQSLLSQEIELHKTYVLDNVSELFREEGRYIDAHVVSGRIKWEHALSMAFMADFRNLMEMSQTLGKLLGSAARIFKAIALCDDGIPLKYRAACSSYCESSFGAGFVQTIVSWFPELGKVQKYMEKANATSLEQALSAYDTGIQNLRISCHCATCEKSYTGFNISARENDNPMSGDGEDSADENYTASEESISDWDPDKFCLVVLTETIIYLARSLANMQVAEGLYPMRSGFEAAYGHQLNLRKSSNLGRSAIREIGQIALSLDFDNSFSWKVEEDMAEIRLFSALELFTGRTPSRRTWGVSGQCINGICAFLGILKDPSDQGSSVGQIYVLPGRIDLENKSYSVLEDQRLSEANGTNFSAVLAQRTIPRSQVIKLRVKEGSSSLQCLLEVPRPQISKENSPILVGPAKLASILASTRGWVSCKKNGKCKKVIGDALDSQDDELPFGEIVLSAFNSASSTHTILALAAASSLQENCSVFLIDKQCHDCCARAAVSIDRPEERNHFCFLRSAS